MHERDRQADKKDPDQAKTCRTPTAETTAGAGAANHTFTETTARAGHTGQDLRRSEAMDINGYVDRVNFHLERLEEPSRPAYEEYLEAWNNQMPARKMAESYKRRLRKRAGVEPEN